MRQIAALALLLALTGCAGDPAPKEGCDSPPTCPEGYEQTPCTVGDSCIEIGEAECTTTCAVDVDYGACLNMATYGTCNPGYYYTSGGCPAGATCAAGTDCYGSYNCVAYTELTPELFETRCDTGEGCLGLNQCEVDEHCTLVPSGSVCGCLDCMTEAVSADVEASYLKALGDAQALCESREPCGDVLCVEHIAHCDLTTSKCVGREAKYVTTTGLPLDCEVAEDCVAVFEGEVCDACQCPNAAIRAEDADVFAAQFDVECAHGVACDCAEAVVACEAGTCVLQ